MQVEAQFSITSQRTRYDYVVASLSPEFAAEVRDLILNVPDRPYDTLKRELIQLTCPPEERRLLLGDSVAVADRPLLRELFLQRLPPTVRMVLASDAASESLEDIAQLADRIIDVAPHCGGPHTNYFSPRRGTGSPGSGRPTQGACDFTRFPPTSSSPLTFSATNSPLNPSTRYGIMLVPCPLW